MKNSVFKCTALCVGLMGALAMQRAWGADSIIVTNPATGHKYQRIDRNVTWTQARDYCKNANPSGGYLATITSKDEENFILSTFPVYDGGWHSYWLGASNASGNWNWVTTTENFTSYTNWANGEPAIANGQYLYLNHTHGSGATDSQWHVGNGDVALPEYGGNFICEWGGQSYKNYVDSAALVPTNVAPQIATLYTDAATGKVIVAIKDARNIVASITNKTITFGTANTSFPQSITVLPDMNSNGSPEIAVLLINKITLKATQEIRDSAEGTLISKIAF